VCVSQSISVGSRRRPGLVLQGQGRWWRRWRRWRRARQEKRRRRRQGQGQGQGTYFGWPRWWSRLLLCAEEGRIGRGV